MPIFKISTQKHIWNNKIIAFFLLLYELMNLIGLLIITDSKTKMLISVRYKILLHILNYLVRLSMVGLIQVILLSNIWVFNILNGIFTSDDGNDKFNS